MRLPASYLKLDPQVIPVRLRILWRTRVASDKKNCSSRESARANAASQEKPSSFFIFFFLFLSLSLSLSHTHFAKRLNQIQWNVESIREKLPTSSTLFNLAKKKILRRVFKGKLRSSKTVVDLVVKEIFQCSYRDEISETMLFRNASPTSCENRGPVDLSSRGCNCICFFIFAAKVTALWMKGQWKNDFRSLTMDRVYWTIDRSK